MQRRRFRESAFWTVAGWLWVISAPAIFP